MENNTNDILKQHRMNAISAKILTLKKIRLFRYYQKIYYFLTIIIPILFVIIQYFSKSTIYQDGLNNISFILSIILIAYSVWYHIIEIDKNIVKYEKSLDSNIYIINEIDIIFANLHTDKIELDWFLRFISEQDKKDNNLMTDIDSETKKWAFREALKESSPNNSDIICNVCKTSPWKYIKGTCNLCGNTPTIN